MATSVLHWPDGSKIAENDFVDNLKFEVAENVNIRMVVMSLCLQFLCFGYHCQKLPF
jgi:hypothetical protein